MTDMKEKSRSISDIITVLTVAVMFAVMLLLVVFAAGSYRRSTAVSEQNADSRAVLAYMVNCVRDSAGSDIRIADRSGIECLVIDSGDGFEHRFYEHDGSLAEEYVSSGTEPDPDNAVLIGDCGSLSLSIAENGILTIKTGRGVSYVDIGRHDNE